MLLMFVISCVAITSCDDDENIVPKPRAYLRLTYPEKKYIKYDGDCPFTCEIPVYSQMENDKDYNAEPCWLNLKYPTFNGTLHLSYEKVDGNLNKFMENTYTLASKHQIKASGIEEQQVSRPKSKVYGLVYDIGGNAASPFQFFLTDSSKHFIRGALYFNAVPNVDSIAPVVDFIKQDIYKMIETFEWKEEDASASPAKAVHKK